jgi:hypothetical protein
VTAGAEWRGLFLQRRWRGFLRWGPPPVLPPHQLPRRDSGGRRRRQPILAAVEVVLIDDRTACRDLWVPQGVGRLQDRGLAEVVRAQVDVVIYREVALRMLRKRSMRS